MNDWIGLIFILILVAGAFLGLRALSKPQTRTEEEFEKGVSESASLLTSGIEALNGFLNPAAKKGKETVEEMKRGTYQKKRKEGKGLGKQNQEENNGR